MKALLAFLGRNAWIFVVLAFAALIVAWSAFITIAAKHGPREIEVRKDRY